MEIHDSPRNSEEIQVNQPKTYVNDYLEKLLKLIPTEIVAVYATLVSFIPKELLPNLIISMFLLLLTPIYLVKVVNVKNRTQLIISTIAFSVWVFYLGGPFYFFEWYQEQEWLRGTALIVFSLIPPIFLGDSRINSEITKEIRSTLIDESILKEKINADIIDWLDLDLSNARHREVRRPMNMKTSKSWREI